MKTFKIIFSTCTEQKKSQNLSKLQRLICKWFKIKPDEGYFFTFLAQTDISGLVNKNDLIIDKYGVVWTVEFINLYHIKIKNTTPIDFREVNGEVAIFSSSLEFEPTPQRGYTL